MFREQIWDLYKFCTTWSSILSTWIAILSTYTEILSTWTVNSPIDQLLTHIFIEKYSNLTVIAEKVTLFYSLL